MADIKYKHAYDENGKLVCIDSISKENRILHKYTCVGCGNPLLPRAIGSKYRKAHFYHKEEVVCSGETYLHKLTKQVVKHKFETEPTFYIEYNVSKKCNNAECKYRNDRCQEEHSPYKVDLKKYYDTCTEESTVKGYIADLLLTNSKNPELEPTLIEVCVSHPCDEEKRNSGLRIIEISIKNEQDIFKLKHEDVISEPLYVAKRERNVDFFSFKRELLIPFHVKLQRYVYIPNQNPVGYLTEIDCSKVHNRLRMDSLIELNVVNTKNYEQCELWDILQWMSKHKGLRRCNLCKFYYATIYEDYAICRLSKKYGKPVHPTMDEAERCSSYRNEERGMFFFNPDDYIIEEVSISSKQMKPEYKVILAASRTFNDYGLFKNKVLHYLSDKIKTHNVVIITGASRLTDMFTDKLSEEIDFIKEPHEADWGKYGQKAISVSNDEMTNSADALIAFWDGKSPGIRNLIEHANKKDIKVAVIPFTPKVIQEEYM